MTNTITNEDIKKLNILSEFLLIQYKSKYY